MLFYCGSWTVEVFKYVCSLSIFLPVANFFAIFWLLLSSKLIPEYFFLKIKRWFVSLIDFDEFEEDVDVWIYGHGFWIWRFFRYPYLRSVKITHIRRTGNNGLRTFGLLTRDLSVYLTQFSLSIVTINR